MAMTPENTPDDVLHQLYEGGATDEKLSKILGGDLGLARATQAALDRLDEVMRPPPGRAYDLHFAYTSFAPVDQRWSCIDLNTYDGAPDSEGCSTLIGYGATEYGARIDLIAQFKEHDAQPKPRVSRLIDGGSGTQPAEYADDDVDFDSDLEDR